MMDTEVARFYTDHPFPDFDLDKYNSPDDLERQASWYFRIFDLYIPDDAAIIEIGCGTGQLVNYLAMKPGRRVVGLDFSQASLSKAAALRDKLGLRNLSFIHRNISNIGPDVGTFQYTFCNGVLHHMRDTSRAFQLVLRVVEPGGFLTVGYYNTIARLPLKLARTRIKKSRTYSIHEKHAHLSRFYDVGRFDDSGLDSWFYDQFQHPLENTVSIAEALKWFSDSGLTYCSSFPPIEGGKELRNTEQPHLQPNPFLIAKKNPQKWPFLGHVLTEISWMIRPKNEGGYYSLVGQKIK